MEISPLTITDDKIEQYVKVCYKAFFDIKERNKKLSMTKVFVGLFGLFFYNVHREINDKDLLASSSKDVVCLLSAEGMYVNTLLLNIN